MQEKDMFLPIKQFLEDLGYSVKAEVKNIDILASKEDKIVVVEMKKAITIKLLYQGCDRQRMFDNVYLAIPFPGYKVVKSKAFKEKIHLLHRLRLGLILVDLSNDNVEVLLDPKEYVRKISKKKRKLLLDEFNQRVSSINIGGVNKQKIMTSYKEQVIKIAKTLLNGPMHTKDIKSITNIAKTTKILYDNYYHWFSHEARGLYGLTKKGREELMVYLAKIEKDLN
jgi:hypothetical protein